MNADFGNLDPPKWADILTMVGANFNACGAAIFIRMCVYMDVAVALQIAVARNIFPCTHAHAVAYVCICRSDVGTRAWLGNVDGHLRAWTCARALDNRCYVHAC